MNRIKNKFRKLKTYLKTIYHYTPIPLYPYIFIPRFPYTFIPLYLYTLIPLFLLYSSCEKVVTINLNSANPVIVIQGDITNLPGPYNIILSNTATYYQPNVFPPVTGAKVIVSDNTGNSETLTEVIPGTYQTAHLQGVPGRTYYMNISTTNGLNFTAASTMPQPAPLDSVDFRERTSNQTYRTVCIFHDPTPGPYYYRLRVTTNDTAGFDTTSVRLLNNSIADTSELTITYRSSLNYGDSVYVYLESIDYPTYEFYFTLPNDEGNVGDLFAAPPANPVNNISNGGLGYFSAYAVTRDTTTAK